MSEVKPLTLQQARFAEEYIVDLNAKEAAIRAGYAENSAKQQGCRLLGHPGVQAAIQAAVAARSASTAITADMVLRELAKVGFADLANVTDWGVKEVAIGFDADGKRLRAEDIGDAAVVQYLDAPFVTPVNRDSLPPAIRAAVAEVALTKDGFKIKMHDKVSALEKIGRHLGMFPNKTEISGPDGGPISVDETTAAARLAALLAAAEARKRDAEG